MCSLRDGSPCGTLGYAASATLHPSAHATEALSFHGCCGRGMMPPAPHAACPNNVVPVTLCLKVTKQKKKVTKPHSFKVQIMSPEAKEMLQACCPWLPKTSLFALAAFLRGHPRGTAGQLGEARGGPRHKRKQTDPDRGMSQRTGPAVLRDGARGPSPCM